MILLDGCIEPGYASFMDLLPIGDGSKYIDMAKAKSFDIDGIIYYRSEHGVWIRKEGEHRPLGRILSEREAFRIFINAGKFDEAEKNFQKLYVAGSIKEATARHPVRLTVGGLVGLLVIAYLVAVTTGTISTNRQISIASLGVIAIGAVMIGILLRPELMHNIQQFELGGFRVTLREKLRDLQKTQEHQSEELDEIRFALELIVTPAEKVHLEHLASGSHSLYKRNEALQAELRRLRAIGLIQSRRYIWEMPDEFDLAEWVELTDRGREYLRRKKDLDAGSKQGERRTLSTLPHALA